MRLRASFATYAVAITAFAQPPRANYDESKIGSYKLPDPLVLANGKPVRDAATWQKQRRPEIVKLFESQVFGKTPSTPPTQFEVLTANAKRKRVRIQPNIILDIFLPAGARKPIPVFLGLNFNGNHSVSLDPDVPLAEIWTKPRGGELKKAPASLDSRGREASRWQLEKVLARGYAVATIYYGDIEPDFDGAIDHGPRKNPGPADWGAIGAWAWGLSRAIDYIEKDKDLDSKRIAVVGHSRLGKTALWAGAQDTRIALVISNDSGEGGAAIARRDFGETLDRITSAFPHWFCANYREYAKRVNDLPVDSNMLLALIAPRPLYVASAAEDLWADPKGEFLGAVGATPVYHLFGKKGIETDKMPGIHEPVGDTVRYHIRAGKHDVTAYDWDQYLDFADKHLLKR